MGGNHTDSFEKVERSGDDGKRLLVVATSLPSFNILFLEITVEMLWVCNCN